MPRSYRQIKDNEEEIIEMREKGCTGREICEKLGLSKKQYENFVTRYNKNQKKLSGGIVIKPKGRPRKNETALPPSIQRLSKLSQLQYELAMKERQIKRLEMENELMGDFLSLTERK